MNDFFENLDRLYAGGNLADVERFILDAVAAESGDSPTRAGLYNELASFYRGVSRYAESAEAFDRALGILEANGMGSSPEYATVLINLAGMHRVMGDMDKAIDKFTTAMRILEGAGHRDSYAYVSILNNLALVYREKGELEKALEYSGCALEIVRAGAGAEHEIATSLNNIASMYLALGELDTTESLISEALAIYDSMAEPDAHHAAALATNAALLHRKGDYRGALEGFNKALGLTRRFFGENIEYAICMRNISEVYEILGDPGRAAAELTGAVAIMEKIMGENHPSVKDAREKLAQLAGSPGGSGGTV